jgi:hypothetical protein
VRRTAVAPESAARRLSTKASGHTRTDTPGLASRSPVPRIRVLPPRAKATRIGNRLSSGDCCKLRESIEHPSFVGRMPLTPTASLLQKGITCEADCRDHPRSRRTTGGAPGWCYCESPPVMDLGSGASPEAWAASRVSRPSTISRTDRIAYTAASGIST